MCVTCQRHSARPWGYKRVNAKHCRDVGTQRAASTKDLTQRNRDKDNYLHRIPVVSRCPGYDRCKINPKSASKLQQPGLFFIRAGVREFFWAAHALFQCVYLFHPCLPACHPAGAALAQSKHAAELCPFSGFCRFSNFAAARRRRLYFHPPEAAGIFCHTA